MVTLHALHVYHYIIVREGSILLFRIFQVSKSTKSLFENYFWEEEFDVVTEKTILQGFYKLLI